MITLDKWRYERIVSELIDGKDIRIIAERFSMDRVFYFHVLRDIASGDRSPNFRLLRKIAEKRKVSTDFVIEQARLVINYTIPNYQSDAPDYYKTLGVDRDAGEDEIRRSWIELMKSNHPDLAGAEAAEAAKRINEAYGVLGNAEKREAYDRRFLSPVPVVVPTFDIQKNIYIGAPILVVILVALTYAAGSGLIFKSQEEKEQMARVIEHPSVPNPVYRGDSVANRADKLEESVAIVEEEVYEVPSAAETIDKSAPLAASEKNIPNPDTEEVIAAVSEANTPEPSGETVAAAPGAAGPAPDEAMVPIVNLPASKISPWVEPEEAEEVEVAENLPGRAPIPQLAPEPEKPAEIAAAPAPVEEKKQEPEKVAASSENKDTALGAHETLSAAADVKEPEAAKPEAEKAPEPEKPVEIAAAPEPEKKAPEKPVAEKKPELEDGTYYTVSSGDSLWTIARKFNTTTAELTRLNNLNNNKLKVGEKLIVSGEPSPLMAAKGADKAPEKPEAPKAAPIKETAKTGPAKSAPAKEMKTAASQPGETSPQVKSATADVFEPGIAATSIAHNTNVVRQPEPAVSSPDKNTLYGFVTEYTTAYRGKDLPRLKTLFSSNAVENGVDLATVMRKYDDSFNTIDILNYDVKVKRALVQNEFGFVRGDFFVTYRDARTGALKSSKGNINWKLAWKDAGWKILEMNYKIEASGGADG